MNIQLSSLLRWMFILGAIVDGAIAVSWFLIASGMVIPNILNGHTGSGTDYELAMYVAAMFMAGWAVILAWGAINPVERRDLLLITSGFLILSVVVELLFFNNILDGQGFMFGIAKRLVIGILFSAGWFYCLLVDHAEQLPGADRVLP